MTADNERGTFGTGARPALVVSLAPMRIEHSLTIAADPSRVWDLTVDLERWPDITPTMTSVERLDQGPIQVGSQARVAQPKQAQRIWTVTIVEEPHHFAWEARLGPIVMEAHHVIDEVPDGCRNTLAVDVTGPASGLIGRLLRSQILTAITTENEGFRTAAESADLV